MNPRHLERARQLAAAARRRSDLERWRERERQLLAVKPRSDEEEVAKFQALELLAAARP